MAPRRIGFVGLGTMGAPMAANLLGAGYTVTVHNRTRSAEEPLEAAGATRASSPGEAASGADIVITMVGDTPDVEEVVFGATGIVRSASPGTLIIDMSTTDPSAAASFHERVARVGLRMIDAPVSGGSEGARLGTLSIMVGGRDQDVADAMPVLEVLGGRITVVGPPGAGQMTKAINQVVIAASYTGLAEGIALGSAAGLNMEAVIEALGGGAAASWILSNRSERMLRRDYPLGFKLRLHRKDLRIALDAAKGLGITLPAAEMVARLEDQLIAQGHGDEDMSVIAEAYF
ncbi:MAG TPA: NAD(P)-dependent oxidoreductase [Actinomycetota bacterium]|nr:NAD(P)-dependent oxidoreductase [Actinomycetota bacterium]